MNYSKRGMYCVSALRKTKQSYYSYLDEKEVRKTITLLSNKIESTVKIKLIKTDDIINTNYMTFTISNILLRYCR